MSLVSALVAVGCGGSQDSGAPAVASTSDALDAQGARGAPEPPMLGIHWARGQRPFGGGGSSPDMTWHGGNILTSTAVQAIYWGTGWSDPKFVNDKISGLEAFYGGVSGSSYLGTCTEYKDATSYVGSGVQYAGYLLDTSAAPSHAPRTSAILSEVCAKITNPVANGYYPVYVDTPRGHASYCAWHSWGTCNGVLVQFGFFFNLDGDAGCDPQDTWTSHSQGLAALANVSGHEISETVTDPRGDAWYDSGGSENADKCAWTFNQPVSFGSTTWKIQGNWSNAAYDANLGYKRGCIDGN